ncbi:cytosolic sulfotransferase 15, partial [Beta vulgaris subsp. vulgaris]|uniref:cytosolic sulfotransferase 15 n=1 Tax=Beta vulgaris subsp. vulgaris TaxID=3555 RepID=UPI0025499E4B
MNLSTEMSRDQTQQEIPVKEEGIENLLQSLPNNLPFIKHQDFWLFEWNLKSVISFQKHFIAQDNDILITSIPKAGSTWLKSLLFAVVNRHISENPLLTYHPQELVYNLEGDVYSDGFDYPRPHHLNELPSPRLLSTHLPYASLTESIKTSGCRILYICRNPFDTLVSFYHFFCESRKKAKGEDYVPPSLEDMFEYFCDGRILYGPFFDHVIGFWKASLELPNKVLFLKYEDFKDDPSYHLKRVAEFIGMPFSQEEESDGVIKQIIEFCSIKNMKELEVNKSGVINKIFEKKSYFRKGEVGDWTNYFTHDMEERMKKLMEDKIEGTG